MPVLCDDDVGLAGTLAREATLPSVEQEDAVGRPMKQAASVDVAQCRAPVLSGFAEPCHRDDRDLDLSGQGLEAAGDGATRFPGSGSAKIGANSFRPSMLLRRTSFAGKDLRRAQVREARGSNPLVSTRPTGRFSAVYARDSASCVSRASLPLGEVHCEEFLGGLLKSYRRAAA